MKSLLRFLPVPENFYDIKKTCNLITTRAVIFPYTVALYVVGMASFASFFAYYSRDTSFISETIIQPSYARAGFTCTPLQPDAHYGITFNYDECQQNMANPSSESVILEDSCASCEDRVFTFYPSDRNFQGCRCMIRGFQRTWIGEASTQILYLKAGQRQKFLFWPNSSMRSHG